MRLATSGQLHGYLADLVEQLESYAITVLPPNDGDVVYLARENDGSLVIDLDCRLPMRRHAKDVVLHLFERWSKRGADEWICVEYGHELRHHELSYRRALHRHHEERFVRAFGVATHEHCEVTLGVADCAHYGGSPVVDAFDALRRLYGLWLTDEKPDCKSLDCLN